MYTYVYDIRCRALPVLYALQTTGFHRTLFPSWSITQIAWLAFKHYILLISWNNVYVYNSN